MEHVLSQLHEFQASVNVSDVGSGSATLYLLNGGPPPPTAAAGDFAYDFATKTIQLRHESNWKTFTVEDIQSRLWHPAGNGAVVCFTNKGMPFWDTVVEWDDPCEFSSTAEILQRFVNTFSPEKVRFSGRSKRQRECERETDREDADTGDNSRRQKHPRLREDGQNDCKSKASGTETVPYQSPNIDVQKQSRFVKSSVGFPKDTPKIVWDAGFEIYMPFSGKGTSDDLEGTTVKLLAECPSVECSASEACNSDPEAFRVADLVVEIMLDPALQSQGQRDPENVATKWKELVKEITSHLSRSTSVVVRGWTPALRLEFSKACAAMLFGGDLGSRCMWADGSVFAANRDRSDHAQHPYHKVTTLEKFIEQVGNSRVCGNFLDGKDMNQSPPVWAKPLFDSNTAWEKTAHLRWLKKAGNSDTIEMREASPTVIRSETWTSQAWKLVTHPGYLTLPHHDCCGMATYIIGIVGAKLWAIMRPKCKSCSTSLKDLHQNLSDATSISDDGKFNADVATVCLEEGDIMFQPPGVLHLVYTPVPSIFSGGYFYNYQTMHLTRAVTHMKKLNTKDSLTNDHRTGFHRTLCRMLIALRFRSEAVKIGRRSLLSLLLLVLQLKSPEKVTVKTKDALAEEERGELAFAAGCVKDVLNWMGITMEKAIKLVDSEGPYYLPGDEVVELPALADGDPDPVFPTFAAF